MSWKNVLGVLESPGKVVEFFGSNRAEALISRFCYQACWHTGQVS